MRTLTRRDVSILIGHALDHFDSSLYGFLAPVLAPLFFPDHDPIVQLILVYSVMGTSILTRPLGAFIFGMVARKHGPLYGLSYSLIGVAVTTVCIGFLPGHAAIGWMAPFGLVVIRMVKGIFAAGEGTIAKLSIMEGKEERQALVASHFYQSAPMAGIVLASAVSLGVIAYYPEAWRFCFWAGGITGGAAYLLRRHAQGACVAEESLSFHSYQLSHLSSLWTHRTSVICVAIATGFGHLTYSIPFVFMNTFIPFITSVSLETMMAFNTGLLIVDMGSIPFIGRWVLRYDGQKVMIVASLVLAVTLVPLFLALPEASLAYVLFVRLWIVFWGVVFLCPLNFWFKGLFPLREQYLLVGMSGALGAATLGRLTVPCCFWLWHMGGSPLWPSLYMVGMTLLTAGALYWHVLKRAGLLRKGAGPLGAAVLDVRSG